MSITKVFLDVNLLVFFFLKTQTGKNWFLNRYRGQTSPLRVAGSGFGNR